jgi:arylsulfatase
LRRPNILIFHSDHTRWDTLGCNGNTECQTPNIDRLAAEGATFDHFFVQNPVCMPSRVSFLTGQYPGALGILGNGVPVPEDTPTAATALANAGYRTGYVGKLHFLPHANRNHQETHPPYGFNHVQISDEPGIYEDAYRAWVRRKAPEQLAKTVLGKPPHAQVWAKVVRFNDGIKHPAERHRERTAVWEADDDLTHSAFIGEETISFIEENKDRPFFCVGGFFAPHPPWVAPKKFLDLYDPEKLSYPALPPEWEAKRQQNPIAESKTKATKHGFYARVSELDHHIGRVLKRLDELGLAENTIVIFTSDHGMCLGERVSWSIGMPEDCGTRVPFVIRWPKGFPSPGRTVSNIVEAVDVIPTLMRAAGVQPTPAMQGRSFLPLLNESAGGYQERPSALTESRKWKAVRSRDYRYVLYPNGNETLYDLKNDPAEYHSVTDDPAYAAILSDLRKELGRRAIETQRKLPNPWSY